MCEQKKGLQKAFRSRKLLKSRFCKPAVALSMSSCSAQLSSGQAIHQLNKVFKRHFVWGFCWKVDFADQPSHSPCRAAICDLQFLFFGWQMRTGYMEVFRYFMSSVWRLVDALFFFFSGKAILSTQRRLFEGLFMLRFLHSREDHLRHTTMSVWRFADAPFLRCHNDVCVKVCRCSLLVQEGHFRHTTVLLWREPCFYQA